jgi:hypothetical protein
MKMKKIVTQQQKKGGSESKAAVKHHLDIWENFKRGIYQDALVRKFGKEKGGMRGWVGLIEGSWRRRRLLLFIVTLVCQRSICLLLLNQPCFPTPPILFADTQFFP